MLDTRQSAPSCIIESTISLNVMPLVTSPTVRTMATCGYHVSHNDNKEAKALEIPPSADNHHHNIISLFLDIVDSFDLPVNTESYLTTVQRRKCCLGALLLHILVVAYFFMGQSFTPSDQTIIGDESSMKRVPGK